MIAVPGRFLRLSLLAALGFPLIVRALLLRWLLEGRPICGGYGGRENALKVCQIRLRTVILLRWDRFGACRSELRIGSLLEIRGSGHQV